MPERDMLGVASDEQHLYMRVHHPCLTGHLAVIGHWIPKLLS